MTLQTHPAASIYAYPSWPTVSHIDRLRHELAVREAADAGGTIVDLRGVAISGPIGSLKFNKLKCRIKEGSYTAPAMETSTIEAVFVEDDPAPVYQIAADAHNPRNFTPEEVGMADGWRLLSKEEIKLGGKKGDKGLEVCLDSKIKWHGKLALGFNGDFSEDCVYRTKQPKGYYLPTPPAPAPYVIDPEAHNPVNLTPDQIGMNEGWRLLTKAELAHCKKLDKGQDGVFWLMGGGANGACLYPFATWETTSGCVWDKMFAYRTKEPAGAFLPKEDKNTNKPAIEWIQVALPDGYRERAIKAVEAQKRAGAQAPCAKRRCIRVAFSWDSTQEGTKFWDDVDEWLLGNKDSLPLLPPSLPTPPVSEATYDPTKLRPAKDWFDTLPSPYSDLAKMRADESTDKSGQLTQVIRAGCIKCSFVWSETPEGHEFWHHVDIHLKYPDTHKLPAIGKFIPWTYATAPKDKLTYVRKKGQEGFAAMVVAWNPDHLGFWTIGEGKHSYQSGLDDYEHSTDGAITWKPCGTYK